MQYNDLEKIKLILGLDDELESSEIQKITVLNDLVEDALLTVINESVVPIQLKWIVVEATVQRYQMLDAEHLQSEGVGDLSFSYRDEGILDKYMDYINAYIKNKASESNTSDKKMRMI